MRLGDRATLILPGNDIRGADIAEVSGGKFGSDIQDLYDEWDAFQAFVAAPRPQHRRERGV